MRESSLLSSRKQALRWAAATAGVGLATAALTFLHFGQTAAGLLFLTMVVWCATRAGLRLSLFVAGLCAVCFDYFFLPPVHTFTLAGPQEWAEMLSFLVSSVVVGRLAERARQQARDAEQRRADVERLYTLSQEMMLQEEPARLIREMPQLLAQSLTLESVLVYLRETDQFYGATDLAESTRASLRALTAGQSADLPGLEGYSARALMLGMNSIGTLAWRPDHLSREAAAAVSAQVALALTRALAVETYTRMEAARESERLHTALIDSLTHELRTPLTSIRAAATTLAQEESLDEALRKDLISLVDEESARLNKLIGEAVEMAEINANVVRVRLAPQHLRSVMDQVAQESQGLVARHRLLVEVEEDDTSAWFDSQLIGRVFRHLIENAARFSPPGSRIRLGARRKEERLEFSVTDSGPGIEAVDLPFIFDKFYRGRKSAAAGDGTGMGLAIAKAILAAHDGGIRVSTKAGEGTVFTFWVPLLEREPSASRNTPENKALS